MYDEPEMMWQEADVPEFTVLYQYCDGWSEENCGNLTTDSQLPGRDSNRLPNEYSKNFIPWLLFELIQLCLL